MSPEKQRIAIAEACGWKGVRKNPPFDKPWDAPLGKSPRATYEGEGFERVPDYLNDLNAMHEAERVLTNEQFNKYRTQLSWVTGWRDGNSAPGWRRRTLSSTAAQRAEAFIRTIGKWEDEQ